MWKSLQRWLNPPNKLRNELEQLKLCDLQQLPLLVIDDAEVFIENPKGLDFHAINHMLGDYDHIGQHVREVLATRSCLMVLAIERPQHNRRRSDPTTPTSVIYEPSIIGLEFVHANGGRYVYWGWVDPKRADQVDFPGHTFDALARRGLDCRTVDNSRIDYRAGRLYQRHNL